jgi:hypothetical protein
MSRIMVADHDPPNAAVDVLVDTSQLNSVLSETLTNSSAVGLPSYQPPSAASSRFLAAYDDPIYQSLTDSARQRALVHVEAGVTVHDLYTLLDKYPGHAAYPDVNGKYQAFGWALPTMGGSGGQTLAGVISTSSHGGDFDRPPIPDMVRAIHIVGSGGIEYFVQRAGVEAIVDPDNLALRAPCLGGCGQIVSDDETFYSVLVSMGRMGIIYSMVIEVVPQYWLREKTTILPWSEVTVGNALQSFRDGNRFLQLLVLPYPGSSGDHDCYVTTRAEVLPGPSDISSSLAGPPPLNLFDALCSPLPDSAVDYLNNLVKGLANFEKGLCLQAAKDLATGGIIQEISSVTPFAPLGDIIGGVFEAKGAVEAAGCALVVDIALPLVQFYLTALDGLNALQGSTTISQALAAVVQAVEEGGFSGLAEQIVNTLLTSFLPSNGEDKTDVSYKIMDGMKYPVETCYTAKSLEVAFNADENSFVNYVNQVLSLISTTFPGEGVLFPGYISIRFCGGSSALLAIEQWSNTVCVETSLLTPFDTDDAVLRTLEDLAVRLGAIVHWGQVNTRTAADIELAFPRLRGWLGALTRLNAGGVPDTFNNVFCEQRGLDIPTMTIPVPVCVIGGERAAGALRPPPPVPAILPPSSVPRPKAPGVPPVPIAQVLPPWHGPPLPQPVAAPPAGVALQDIGLGTLASADECCTCECAATSFACAWYRSSPRTTEVAGGRGPTASGRT